MVKPTEDHMQQDAVEVESTQQQYFYSHWPVYSQRFKDSVSCFILDSLQREIIQPDKLFPECLMTNYTLYSCNFFFIWDHVLY